MSKSIDELIRKDITVDVEYRNVRIEAKHSAYHLFVNVSENSFSYCIMHSEDGEMDKGDILFDSKEFIEKCEVDIVSFSHILKLLMQVPKGYFSLE